MILTSKIFSDAMEQVNIAFAAVNKKVDKLEQEVKALTKEKADGSKKRPKAS